MKNDHEHYVSFDRSSFVNLNRDHPELADGRLEARRKQLESELVSHFSKVLNAPLRSSWIKRLSLKLKQWFQPANVKPVATGND